MSSERVIRQRIATAGVNSSLLIPARCAARLHDHVSLIGELGSENTHIFSFNPPTGNTCPKSDISPVIATSGSTLVFVNSETRAVRIAVPALGPSFPIAPSGLQTIRDYQSIKCQSQSLTYARADPGH